MFFIGNLNYGGAERVASNLANHWCRRGHDVAVLTVSETTPDDYTLENKIYRIALCLDNESENLFAAIKNNFVRLVALRNHIKAICPEVIVAFMPSANILAICAALNTPTRVIISERNHPPNGKAAAYWLRARKWLYRYANHIVVLAEESRRWIIENTHATRVSVIPNMLDWPLKPYGIPVPPPKLVAESRMLLAVGRLVTCLLYTSPSPRDATLSRMPSSA